MSAAWDGDTGYQETEVKQWRVIRMWLYTLVGVAFYSFLRYKVGV